jgi:hypothetical protein
VSVTDGYFNERAVRRERLFWAVATRRQLERWETLVVAILNDDLAGRQSDGTLIWSEQIERHLALVTARNLLRALDLSPKSNVSIDRTLYEELVEGRNLNEHWPENMPVFNVTPRPREPASHSGKRFAARNPRKDPYSLGYTNKAGALLLPNVSAFSLHDLIDAVEAEALASDDSVGRFVPPRTPSPWVQDEYGWWPKSEG